MSPGFHDRMIVSWVSNSTTGDALVMWGVTADALNETAPATHDTYTADDFTNCMGIPPIKTLDSPFPHLSSHDLRSALSPPPAITAPHTPTNGPADAVPPAMMIPPPASCTSTPASCTTRCCSLCSPRAGTTTGLAAATVAGVKCTRSSPRVLPATRRPSRSCTLQLLFSVHVER